MRRDLLLQIMMLAVMLTGCGLLAMAKLHAFTGMAARITDRGTLHILVDTKQEHTIRLAGIDASSAGSRSPTSPARA